MHRRRRPVQCIAGLPQFLIDRFFLLGCRRQESLFFLRHRKPSLGRFQLASGHHCRHRCRRQPGHLVTRLIPPHAHRFPAGLDTPHPSRRYHCRLRGRLQSSRRRRLLRTRSRQRGRRRRRLARLPQTDILSQRRDRDFMKNRQCIKGGELQAPWTPRQRRAPRQHRLAIEKHINQSIPHLDPQAVLLSGRHRARRRAITWILRFRSTTESRLHFRATGKSAGIHRDLTLLRRQRFFHRSIRTVKSQSHTAPLAAPQRGESQRDIKISRHWLQKPESRRHRPVTLLLKPARRQRPLTPQQTPTLRVHRRKTLGHHPRHRRRRHIRNHRRSRFHLGQLLLRTSRFFLSRQSRPLSRHQLPARRRHMRINHPRLPLRLPRHRWQYHRSHHQLTQRQNRWHPRSHDRRPVRPRLITTDKPPCRFIQQTIVNSRHPVTLEIDFSRNHVEPHLIRLKKGPDSVIIELRDRIVFVIVTLGAINRQSHQPFAHVFHRFLHPRMAVKQEKVPRQKSGGPQLGHVSRMQLVGRQHQTNHFRIRHVFVQRLHNPVAPVPHVLLAVAQLIAEPPPVTVPPDIHPVASPSLAMPGISQQSIHRRRVLRPLILFPPTPSRF